MLATDPNSTFNRSLWRDREKPAAERPVFVFRYATARVAGQARALMALDLATDADADSACRAMFDLLRRQLAGWTVPDGRAFDPAALEDLLTDAEGWELLRAMAMNLGDPPAAAAVQGTGGGPLSKKE